MVIGVGMEFDQYFSDDSDPRLAGNVPQGKGIKFTYAYLRELGIADTSETVDSFSARSKPVAPQRVPALIKSQRRAWIRLVGSDSQQHLLNSVADDQGLNNSMINRNRELKSGVFFQSLQGHGNDRDLRVSGISQSLTQQRSVVCRPTHPAGLAHGYGSFIRVGSSGNKFVDELPQHHQ